MPTITQRSRLGRAYDITYRNDESDKRPELTDRKYREQVRKVRAAKEVLTGRERYDAQQQNEALRLYRENSGWYTSYLGDVTAWADRNRNPFTADQLAAQREIRQRSMTRERDRKAKLAALPRGLDRSQRRAALGLSYLGGDANEAQRDRGVDTRLPGTGYTADNQTPVSYTHLRAHGPY